MGKEVISSSLHWQGSRFIFGVAAVFVNNSLRLIYVHINLIRGIFPVFSTLFLPAIPDRADLNL